DGLELNLYEIAADPEETGEAVERRALAVARTVRQSISIPLAVKISPFYSSVPNFARRLEEASADGLVLLNRFYPPALHVEQLDVVRVVQLSDAGELRLRLRWLAMLSGKVRMSLAATGGVHTALDAIKAIMAGADAVQLVSALLQRGPGYLKD